MVFKILPVETLVDLTVGVTVSRTTNHEYPVPATFSHMIENGAILSICSPDYFYPPFKLY